MQKVKSLKKIVGTVHFHTELFLVYLTDNQIIMKAKRIKLISAGLLVLVLAVFLITCPGRRAHREALIDAIGNEIIKTANLNEFGDASQSLKQANYEFYNAAVNPCLKVLGYGLFSIGYIEEDGNRQKVSFGIMGHVTVKDKDHITRRIPLLREPKPVTIEDAAADKNETVPS